MIAPKKLQNAVMQELHPKHGMAEEGGKKLLVVDEHRQRHQTFGKYLL